VSDIQRESRAVIESIKKNYFHGAFDAWKNDGYIPNETMLKEMAAKIE
jgi:hypothetical protein